MVDTIINSITVQPNPTASDETYTVGEGDVVCIDEVVLTMEGGTGIAVWKVNPDSEYGNRIFIAHEFSKKVIQAVTKIPKPKNYRD
jgi:hypothetical protein